VAIITFGLALFLQEVGFFTGDGNACPPLCVSYCPALLMLQDYCMLMPSARGDRWWMLYAKFLSLYLLLADKCTSHMFVVLISDVILIQKIS
jgi:hypothetical protein